MSLKSYIKKTAIFTLEKLGLRKIIEYKVTLDSFIKREENERLNYEYSDKKHVKIYDGARLCNSEISAHSYVALDSIVYSAKIGKFCSIGPKVVIGYGDHPTDFISTSTVLFNNDFNKKTKIEASKDYFDSHREVVIGNDVWVGANVYIKNGIKISDGAIIGSGSVVTKDIPPYAIYGGVPAKLIRYRFDEYIINELLKLKWWDWTDEKIKEAQPLFSQPLTKNILNKILSLNNQPNEYIPLH